MQVPLHSGSHIKKVLHRGIKTATVVGLASLAACSPPDDTKVSSLSIALGADSLPLDDVVARVSEAYPRYPRNALQQHIESISEILSIASWDEDRVTQISSYDLSGLSENELAHDYILPELVVRGIDPSEFNNYEDRFRGRERIGLSIRGISPDTANAFDDRFTHRHLEIAGIIELGKDGAYARQFDQEKYPNAWTVMRLIKWGVPPEDANQYIRRKDLGEVIGLHKRGYDPKTTNQYDPQITNWGVQQFLDNNIPPSVAHQFEELRADFREGGMTVRGFIGYINEGGTVDKLRGVLERNRANLRDSEVLDQVSRGN